MEQTSQDFKRFIILTPKSMSKSARALKDELQTYINVPIILVSPHSPTYQGRWSDYVVNWGYSKETDYIHVDDGNYFSCIADAVNKLNTFICLTEAGVQTVEWTTAPAIAKTWWEEGKTVVGRVTLSGYGGTGIVILDENTPFKDDCKLYTLYKKKKNEYRVHVFRDEVIDITQKKKKKGAVELNTKIRNYHNGWVYCRSDIHIPADLTELALSTSKALDLAHSAVDIIWNEKEDKCYVLEVNTAPGLTGTTLTKYVNAFVKDFQA